MADQLDAILGNMKAEMETVGKGDFKVPFSLFFSLSPFDLRKAFSPFRFSFFKLFLTLVLCVILFSSLSSSIFGSFFLEGSLLPLHQVNI